MQQVCFTYDNLSAMKYLYIKLVQHEEICEELEAVDELSEIDSLKNKVRDLYGIDINKIQESKLSDDGKLELKFPQRLGVAHVIINNLAKMDMSSLRYDSQCDLLEVTVTPDVILLPSGDIGSVGRLWLKSSNRYSKSIDFTIAAVKVTQHCVVNERRNKGGPLFVRAGQVIQFFNDGEAAILSDIRYLR